MNTRIKVKGKTLFANVRSLAVRLGDKGVRMHVGDLYNSMSPAEARELKKQLYAKGLVELAAAGKGSALLGVQAVNGVSE